jgi:hypothetical protein
MKQIYADENDDSDEMQMACPYCRATEACEHLLVKLDRTFREAIDGPLWKTFNSRWADTIEDADDPDFDEREIFENFIDDLRSISDVELIVSPESAPGMSSAYSLFFCSSKKKVSAAKKLF